MFTADSHFFTVDGSGTEVDGSRTVSDGHVAGGEVSVNESIAVAGAVGDVEFVASCFIVAGLISDEDVSTSADIGSSGFITDRGVVASGGVGKHYPVTDGSIFGSRGIGIKGIYSDAYAVLTICI